MRRALVRSTSLLLLLRPRRQLPLQPLPSLSSSSWRGCRVLVAATSLSLSSSSPLTCARRGIRSWNPLTMIAGDKAIVNTDLVNVEEEMPYIFADQPAEVNDYIRPEKTTFERLEDMWDWAVGFMQPVDKQMEVMRGLHAHGIFGFDFGGWGHVFFFYGIVLRLLTLVPSLYAHRNTLRLAHINPQLNELTTKITRVKQDRAIPSAERRVVLAGYTRLKKALCKQHNCSQVRGFVAMALAPITISAFLSIRRLTMYEADLEGASFLWVRDLSMPDPTYILPCVCAGMFLVNFELNQRMQKGGRSASALYTRWGVRVLSVVGVYFFAGQPAALYAYWIGLSLVGLVQPLLLRWQPFRDAFAFPDPPQASRSMLISSRASSLPPHQAALLRGPTLYERLFASREQRAAREAERREARAALLSQKYDNIDNYDVVFDDNDGGGGGGGSGAAHVATAAPHSRVSTPR